MFNELIANRDFPLYRKSFILGILACLISVQTFAAFFEYTPKLKEAQVHIACLRLKKANQILAVEFLKQPDNVAVVYLKHYSRFFHIMVQQDKLLLPEFEKVNSEMLLSLQKLPNESPYKLFLKGSVHLQSALVKGAFNEYLSAAWDFRSAYQEVNANEKKFPNFNGHKKELGALMALIGSFPPQYQWVVNVAGLNGDFKNGLKVLEEYISLGSLEPILEQQQASVIYTLIQLNFGADKNKAWNFYAPISKDYKNNLMQCYVRAYVAGKCGENEIALATLKGRPLGLDYENITYFNLLMGDYLLHQLDGEAAIWYKKYIAFSTTKGATKDAYQKLSWISWLENDTTKFIIYHDLMAKNTKDAGSELKLLNEDLKNGIYPSKELLKARILFDGGYYDESLAVLSKLNKDKLPCKYQKIEWDYRMARVLQEQKHLTESLNYFKKCLEGGMAVNTYLIPNSCLQIGLIYEQLNYPLIAKSYYERVSNYHHVDYESSMAQKAKTNIWRINKSK
ncbi:MAG: hypothetical protein SGJ00_02775 [bacterium]|nr:hypothetical protein [bacterium]